MMSKPSNAQALTTQDLNKDSSIVLEKRGDRNKMCIKHKHQVPITQILYMDSSIVLKKRG